MTKSLDLRTIWFDTHEPVPSTIWRWPNFRPDEIRCKGDGTLLLDARAMDRLQELRIRMGKPLILTSAYRSAYYNQMVGGASLSFHRQGRAWDISREGHDLEILVGNAQKVGFTGFGFYDTFLHVDDGPKRHWGNRKG